MNNQSYQTHRPPRQQQLQHERPRQARIAAAEGTFEPPPPAGAPAAAPPVIRTEAAVTRGTDRSSEKILDTLGVYATATWERELASAGGEAALLNAARGGGVTAANVPPLPLPLGDVAAVVEQVPPPPLPFSSRRRARTAC